MIERLERILAGDVATGARLIRDVDDRIPAALAHLSQLFAHTGRAYIIGVTGNPGAGKSTLSSAMISAYRARGLRVAVVCVDPSSPFSGGAILGDRIRMQAHALDSGVFIRSLATRGKLGGLSRSTFDVVSVLDAMGYERILIETVGVGQDEVDVMRAAHTSVVVTVPGLGDDVQAIKAGILEIADVLVVNKADREGSDRTVRDLQNMLTLRDCRSDGWEVRVLETTATSALREGSGVSALVSRVEEHRQQIWQGPAAAERQLERARQYVLEWVRQLVADEAARVIADDERFERAAATVRDRVVDPQRAARELLAAARAESAGRGADGSAPSS